MAGIAFGNGRTVSRLSDLDYRTSSINDSSAGGLSFGLGYDALGNINRLKPAHAEISVLAYGYDALSRLSHVRDGLTGTTIESYGYDATGNRSSFTNAGGAQIYTYATDSHRLMNVGSSSLRDYDANGNSKAINGKELVYDDANRLVEVRVGAAALQNYAYNGRGEQVHKHGSATGSHLIYDESGRWIAAYGDDGEAIQQIIWMDSLPVGLWDKGGIQSRLHYIEADHLGAPRVVIDPAQNTAVWRWDLKGEVFGNSHPEEDVDQDGTLFVFNMRFPGQLSDSVAGWNYNYYRNYDPATGRYIESDPIGLHGGFSTYSYVFGRPLQFVDPYGLESQCVNGEDVVRQYNIVTGKIENMGYRTALFCSEGGGSCKYFCAKDKARCDGQVAAYPYAVAAACVLISGGRRGGGVGFAAGVACSAVTASIDSSKLPAACQYAYRKCIDRCDGCEK